MDLSADEGYLAMHLKLPLSMMTLRAHQAISKRRGRCTGNI
jgi:hypothetical protein